MRAVYTFRRAELLDLMREAYDLGAASTRAEAAQSLELAMSNLAALLPTHSHKRVVRDGSGAIVEIVETTSVGTEG